MADEEVKVGEWIVIVRGPFGREIERRQFVLPAPAEEFAREKRLEGFKVEVVHVP